MTEFGKSPYLSVDTLAALGYCMVIFPMSAFRVMMKSVEDLLSAIRDQGTPKAQIDRMQTRQELYQLLQYDRYTAMDNAIAQRFPEDLVSSHSPHQRLL
jgi:methylisocitrate lyase